MQCRVTSSQGRAATNVDAGMVHATVCGSPHLEIVVRGCLRHRVAASNDGKWACKCMRF